MSMQMLYSFNVNLFEMNSELDQKLYKAVARGEFDQVKNLLAAGANVHFVVKEWCGETTLLHYASTVEIVRELLLYGADIEARDYNGKTPLLHAVSQRKQLPVVLELLEHGADPNARSMQGTTALTPAIAGRNLDLIKTLLDYGADINIRTTAPLLRYPTPLAVAVSAHEECAKLLIKHTLINNFNDDYKKVVNLDLYSECMYYRTLSNFMEDCVCEIVQMKTENVNDNLSVYDFLIEKTEFVKSLYDKFREKDKQLLTDFPIYHEFIFYKVDLYLQRVVLLDKLNCFQIVNQSSNDLNSEIILNSDCLSKIAEYLCNKDLFRFISAFDSDIELPPLYL